MILIHRRPSSGLFHTHTHTHRHETDTQKGLQRSRRGLRVTSRHPTRHSWEHCRPLSSRLMNSAAGSWEFWSRASTLLSSDESTGAEPRNGRGWNWMELARRRKQPGQGAYSEACGGRARSGYLYRASSCALCRATICARRASRDTRAGERRAHASCGVSAHANRLASRCRGCTQGRTCAQP